MQDQVTAPVDGLKRRVPKALRTTWRVVSDILNAFFFAWDVASDIVLAMVSGQDIKP